MTEQALQTTEPFNVPATLDAKLGNFTGYEDYGDDDWIIPRVKIIQGSTKEGTPGTYRNNLTGLEKKTMGIAVIKVEPGRVKWPTDEQVKAGAIRNVPLCRSYDGWAPDPAVENPPCDKCALPIVHGPKKSKKFVCPDAMWGDNRERPACDETLNILALDLDDMLPFWMAVSGTSLAPLKRYVSSVGLRKKRLVDFTTELSLIEVTGDVGRYYVMNFSAAKPLTDNQAIDILEMAEAYKAESIKRTMDKELEQTMAEAESEQEAQADGSGDAGDGQQERCAGRGAARYSWLDGRRQEKEEKLRPVIDGNDNG